MPQDAFTLKFIADELSKELVGAKINRINQPNPDEVVLFTYNKGSNKKLLVSTNAVSARISFIEKEKPNPLTAYGFCMLLRKYLIGGEITKVEAIKNERIIKITLSALNDFFESKQRELYAEIMGKYSNVVLSENDKIIGSLKSFNLSLDSLRPLVSGMNYTLPPKQDKFLPDDPKLIAALDKKSEEDGFSLYSFLFENVIGLAKNTAKEIETRYFNKENTLNAGKVYEFLNEFLVNPGIKPCVKLNQNGMPKDFFITDYISESGETEFYDNVVTAQEECFRKKDEARIFGDYKRKLAAVVKKTDDKLKKRKKIIDEKEKNCSDAEEIKIKGELILANLYRIKRGDDTLIAENYYDGTTVKIPLDKTLTPSENAERYYKKYNKEKRTTAALVPQREELFKEIDYVNSLYSFINAAETYEDLLSVENELKAVGFIKSEAKKQKKKLPEKYDTFIVDGVTVKIGKNNVSNDELTSSADRNFYWMHVKGYHSAHVIICDKTPSENVIKTAAEICAYRSEARNGGKTEVDYTLKKYVKKPQGANPGFVNYTDYETISVMPEAHADLMKTK
ncbi:MAG TPA: hypothetical protein DHU65_04580 [Clostridiales bacterium]|nr:hypothetical protein [Clostridiales bacterium]